MSGIQIQLFKHLYGSRIPANDPVVGEIPESNRLCSDLDIRHILGYHDRLSEYRVIIGVPEIIAVIVLELP